MTATDGLRAYIRGFAKLPLTVSNATLQCLETPFNRDCISNKSVFLHSTPSSCYFLHGIPASADHWQSDSRLWLLLRKLSITDIPITTAFY